MPLSLEEEENEYHGDAILVKDEYSWSRPSSPESADMSPDMDVGDLLAQINPQLESPEPLEEDLSAAHPMQHTQLHANQAASQHSQARPARPNASTMEERLNAMEEQRVLPWRDGVEIDAANETGGDSRRKQIRFGCLLARKGEVQAVPCATCANGRGKFTQCIALEGFFKGACASCQLSGRPNRCSIKKNDDDAQSPTARNPTNVPRHAGQSQPSSNAPQPKRRKKSAAAEQTKTIPEWESARPQWQQELGEAHARQQMKEIAQRPWTTVNSPIMANPQATMNGMPISGSRIIPQSLGEHRNSLGGSWATVKQAPSMPPSGRFSSGPGSSSGNHRNTMDPGRGDDTGEDGAALIDTLPKNKQRQVYGLVSGLQGGIEHLQRELDSLKKALGIDED